eukprot:5553497-Pyramimonas_sp.AAC.1
MATSWQGSTRGLSPPNYGKGAVPRAFAEGLLLFLGESPVSWGGVAFCRAGYHHCPQVGPLISNR